MNTDRFDAFVRAIGGSLPRRSVLRAVQGLAVGGLAGFQPWSAAEDAAAACVALGRICKRRGTTRRCCGGATCKRRRCACPNDEAACADKCVDPLTNPRHCGQCGLTCVSGQCLHGACMCDPFNNQCPTSVDGQCGCGAVQAAPDFQAACVDRLSACDLDRPCDDSGDCPAGSVCLLGCSDTGNPRRCSTPCTPV